jgi:UDP-N-acetylmuramyl-tripeptide synthetase
MRRLNSPQEAAQWLHGRVQGVLHTDSRQVAAGDGFIAWPGAVNDGRQFVSTALDQGARACLVEQDGAEVFPWASDAGQESVASYQGLKAASGPIAAAYYEQPSLALDVLAVTGTNGKTSTAWWLAHALNRLGQRCAMVGTLGVGDVDHLESTGMTTPDPVLLQSRLRDMAQAGVKACAIEASSIGLVEHRLDGTRVRVAMFTNFTQDHLDYHEDMARYWQAKSVLFDWPELQTAVVNLDDSHGERLAQQLTEHAGVQLWTVSCHTAHTPAQRHLQARAIRHGVRGMTFDVLEGHDAHTLQTEMVGDYNVSNLLGVMATLRALGHALSDIVRVCQDLPAVPGRMQVVAADHGPLTVVDFAHTPDALAKALQALRPLAQSRGGALWCVVGCGGNRDASKRPLMAAVAQQHADSVVLTSDNPRHEDPRSILAQMQSGLSATTSVQVIEDRAQAIDRVLANAKLNDVVLLAGKGHEDYQDIAGVKVPFSDVTQARAALARRGNE